MGAVDVSVPQHAVSKQAPSYRDQVLLCNVHFHQTNYIVVKFSV